MFKWLVILISPTPPKSAPLPKREEDTLTKSSIYRHLKNSPFSPSTRATHQRKRNGDRFTHSSPSQAQCILRHPLFIRFSRCPNTVAQGGPRLFEVQGHGHLHYCRH